MIEKCFIVTDEDLDSKTLSEIFDECGVCVLRDIIDRKVFISTTKRLMTDAEKLKVISECKNDPIQYGNIYFMEVNQK